MAEELLVVPAAQPMAGFAYGGKTQFVPVGINYIRFLANNSMSPITVSSGAKGDFINGILVSPTTSAIGAIWLQDGASSAFSALIVSNGTLADIKPFYVPINARSTQGGWQISTSAGGNILVSGAF